MSFLISIISSIILQKGKVLRTIVGNLSDLGFVDIANITINFILVNKFGKPIKTQTEFMANTLQTTFSTTSDSNGDFSISLFENGNINKETYYQVTVGSNNSFNIYIPLGDTDVDILCLVNRIDYDGIVSIEDSINGDVYRFTDDFISKFNAFLENKTIHLSRSEEKLIDKYVALINIPKERRCSDIDELDRHLTTILPKEEK